VARRSVVHYYAAGLLTIVTTTCASALHAARYHFESNDHYLTRASDYPRWANLIARDALQRGEIDACLAEVERCPPRLRGYREIVVGGRDLSPERKIRLVNQFINTRRWSIERDRNDDWRTIDDFLRLGGDCEDFAIAKYFLLRRMGFAPDDLRVLIAWDTQTRAHHALTAVRLDDRSYILDVDGGPRTYGNDYRILFSINEIGIWDHAAPATAIPAHIQPEGVQHP
jgi:predicted transglutaminase-like cysteine proteinase